VFKSSSGHDRENMSTRQVATTLGYIHQILFQTCAGAVLLTDGVFWFIIYPFLTAKDFNLDFVSFNQDSRHFVLDFLVAKIYPNITTVYCDYALGQCYLPPR
jgi:hypothetical protein